MKKIFVLFVSATIAFFMAFVQMAHADLLDDINQRKVLRVAIDVGAPPYGMLDDKMQPTGLDVEMAKLLAEYLGVKLEIVQVINPNRIPSILTGKSDVTMASLAVTPDRAKVIDFSAPYSIIDQIVAAPKSFNITKREDLDGKRVAVTRGTTNDMTASQQLPNVTIIRFDDDATLVTALATKQEDIIVSAQGIINAASERRVNDPLENKIVLKTVPVAIGLRKGEPGLKAKLDEWVKTDMANDKINTVARKYLGKNIDFSALTE